MPYFEDLTEYTYMKRGSEGDSLNIGWLSGDHVFDTGPVPAEVVPRLDALSELRFNQTRGVTACPINGEMFLKNSYGSVLSSAEIKVYGAEKVYSAPNLILHFVQDHQYRPPEEFIEALLGMDRPGSTEFTMRFREFYGQDRNLQNVDAVRWV